jgi:KaiC/GvpD/RAD55 family RecA-like ATPase
VTMSDRVASGIKGFDELVQGGFNRDSVNLIIGGPGCGKTLFCLEFLWNGILRGQKGLYVSFEQSLDDLREDAKAMGWDFSGHEASGMMRFMFVNPYVFQDIHYHILEEILRTDAQRVVLDSVSIYGLFLHSDFEVRKDLIDLSISLKKKKNCVTLLVGESMEGLKKMSRFDVEEFLADSIILLTFESMGGQFSRSLMVRKMRRTKNDEDIHPLEISHGGLVIHQLK